MTNQIHFVLNSHGLGFDRYSLLCIKSLRRACGNGARVTVYCPTNLPPPSDTALQFYRRYDVGIVEFRNEFLPDTVTHLNDVKARRLTYNKLYTLDDVREGERRVFLDADIIFLRDPRPYLEKIKEPTACVAVDTPESFLGDWQGLYSELGVAFPQETIEVWETYVYGDKPEPQRLRIPPYLCSSVVCVDADSRVPQLWRNMCSEIEAKIELLPQSFFVDQIGLSVAVQKAQQPWHLLPRVNNMAIEIWRYVQDPCLFHYVTFDALAAANARFPEVKQIMVDVVRSLAREDGLDLRFELLTQWPRWYRRTRGIASDLSERWFGVPLESHKVRE